MTTCFIASLKLEVAPWCSLTWWVGKLRLGTFIFVRLSRFGILQDETTCNLHPVDHMHKLDVQQSDIILPFGEKFQSRNICFKYVGFALIACHNNASATFSMFVKCPPHNCKEHGRNFQAVNIIRSDMIMVTFRQTRAFRPTREGVEEEIARSTVQSWKVCKRRHYDKCSALQLQLLATRAFSYNHSPRASHNPLHRT